MSEVPQDPPVPGSPAHAPVGPPIPGDLLHALGARVLDPVSAPRLPGQGPLRPVPYVGDSLLVGGLPNGAAAPIIALLQQRLADGTNPRLAGVEVTVSDQDNGIAAIVAELDGEIEFGDGDRTLSELVDQVWTTRVTLTSTIPAGQQVDAFEALQHLRALGDPVSDEVSLEHVVIPGSLIGTSFWGGHGFGVSFWGGHGQGGAAIYWGRTPVAWTGLKPTSAAPRLNRTPVVAIPDTGLGRHPWFDGDPDVVIADQWRGLPLSNPAVGNPDATLGTDPRTGQLDELVGHGTFIAGLIRQQAPRAAILALPVMSGSGVVDEGSLRNALVGLLVRHLHGQLTGAADQIIDVLSLSLGYYHELPADDIRDGTFHRLIAEFVDAGVVVVAAAGNDSTTEPLLPAGFAAALPAVNLSAVTLAGVGALNPASDTVALFSNRGAWVTAHRQGASVVSTMPVDADGSAQAAVRFVDSDNHPRGSIDPDNFRSGFAVWNGTSFAAPVYAAEVAALLGRELRVAEEIKTVGNAPGPADFDVISMRARADVVRAEVKSWTQP